MNRLCNGKVLWMSNVIHGTIEANKEPLFFKNVELKKKKSESRDCKFKIKQPAYNDDMLKEPELSWVLSKFL